MADLENMLLEAAGRSSSPVRKRHKLPKSRMKREGSYPDGGSDSREEDSDDDVGVTSKRPSRSQSHVPLKKRIDPSKRGNEHGGKEGGEYDDGGSAREGDSSDESDVGSDLYKNEDDKQRLAKMTELEREMILSDRAAKKGEKEFKEQLRMKRDNAKATQSRRETPPCPSYAKVRSSARYAERTAAKGDVLSELRAKRMKQHNIDTHGKTGNASRASSTSKGISPAKQKSKVTASPSSSSQSESIIRSDSDRESSDDGGLADSDDDKNMPGSEGPTFEDIKEIAIRRSKLVKWLIEPFFEELIVGCFVRIGIGKSDSGPVYRLCMVQSVDASDQNKLYKVENRVTYKYLVCIWGSENSAAKFQMAVVSDSPPLEKEFKQLLREIERTCSQMPSKQDVLEKREAIRKINSYIYSAATVKQMLEEKKTAPSRPLNVAVEKDRLKRLLEIAKSKHDEDEMDRIYTRLQELEASRQARNNDAKAMRLAEMNRKNRVENFKNLSELKRMSNSNLKAGEEGYDPFSRRWTRSRNYYASEPGEVNEYKEGEGEGEREREEDEAKGENFETTGEDIQGEDTKKKEEELITTKVGVEATEAALQAAANAGKLIDTMAPVDHGTESNRLHDFDLPISLAALQKHGGPQGVRNGFLARKQKLEATVGCQVRESDGSRHALTLTISDYKRRRGLL